jgi:tRNA (guanine-N7-)-methyltransferase
MNTSFPILDVTEYYLPLDDLCEVFGNGKRTALEIGFGEGDFLIEMAKRKIDWNFVGIEIKRKRFNKAAKRAQREKTNNVKLLLMDARIAVEEVFSQDTFSEMYINFPDPWPKDRHKKHRIINQKFLYELSCIMKPLAALEIASDHEEYISHILEVFENMETFRSEFPSPGYVNSLPDRPMTKYELEFREEGREVYYLRLINLKNQNL